MNQLFFVTKLLLALSAGMLTTLAYAPYSYASLPILCPAILLILWGSTSPKNAALIGLCYGIGLFSTGTWWIFISMHEFGHMEAPLAFIATVIVVLYEALFPAVQGYVLSRWTRPGSATRALLFFPSSWVCLEWLRSFLFTGWHWLIVGYTQIDSPLGGYAPIIGTYGLSFLVILTAGILVLATEQLFSAQGKPTPISLLKSLWPLTLALLFITVIWVNGAFLKNYSFTQDNGKTLTISLLQGNVPQEQKWQPDQLNNIVDRYYRMTQRHWKSDLIIWPEGAIPALSTVAEPFLNSLSKEAQQQKTHVMLGIAVAEGKYYYNALLMLGETQGYYYKRHLVPFGEYLPFKTLLNPIISALQIPMSNFSSGPQQQTLMTVNGIPMATYICYEIVEPDEVRRTLSDAELIVTITDDSWFDDSIASEQHLQMARMRSLENGLPQVFLSSRGASAVITPEGKMTQRLPQHQQGVITATVSAAQGKTPWRTLGSWPVLLVSLLAIIASVRSKKAVGC